LWARALPWSIVLGMALWIAYKFVRGVAIQVGLGGSGIPTVLGVVAAFALYLLSVRLIERRMPNELGVARLAPELAGGVALGAACFSAIMGVLLATGVYTLTGPTAAALWQPLRDSLDGVVEELIFRGAVFRLFWSAFGVWWALGLSSALFGTLHLGKPGADLMGVLGVMFGGGIPMAALYLLTRRLWASIGYHISWNFTEAYVFGAQVSGTGLGPSLYQSDRSRGSTPSGAAGPSAQRHQQRVWLWDCWSAPQCLQSRSFALDRSRGQIGAPFSTNGRCPVGRHPQPCIYLTWCRVPEK
jgi:CAAX protease family protein